MLIEYFKVPSGFTWTIHSESGSSAGRYTPLKRLPQAKEQARACADLIARSRIGALQMEVGMFYEIPGTIDDQK